MKKKILITICAILIWLIIEKSGLFAAVLIFLITGSIPGTTILLSPSEMFALIALLAVISVVSLAAPSAKKVKLLRLSTKQHRRNKNLPARRYSNIKLN